MMTWRPNHRPFGSSRRARSTSRCSAQYGHSSAHTCGIQERRFLALQRLYGVVRVEGWGQVDDVEDLAGMPSWVAIMLRTIFARPVACTNGVATEPAGTAQRRQPAPRNAAVDAAQSGGLSARSGGRSCRPTIDVPELVSASTTSRRDEVGAPVSASTIGVKLRQARQLREAAKK